MCKTDTLPAELTARAPVFRGLSWPCQDGLFAAAGGVVLVEDLLFRRGGQQADDDDGRAGHEETGEQLIDVPGAAHRAHEEFPHEDHDAAAEHARKRAPFIAALPEQGEEHHRTEGGAEARPGEGDDAEHGARGVAGDEHADDGDAEHGDARGEQGHPFGELDAEHALHDVFGNAGCGGKELGVGRGHGAGEDAGEHEAGDECGDHVVLAEQAAELDDQVLCVRRG